MGKFAGFLKRAKKLANIAGSVLNGLNDIYKSVKPYADNIVSSLVPHGDEIVKGLNYGSKIIDTVKPITDNFMDEEDKQNTQKISNNIKRYGGDIVQKALNNYMDEQEAIYNNKGNYTLNDYAIKTGGDIFSGLIKNKGPIFGEPLN